MFLQLAKISILDKMTSFRNMLLCNRIRYEIFLHIFVKFNFKITLTYTTLVEQGMIYPIKKNMNPIDKKKIMTPAVFYTITNPIVCKYSGFVMYISYTLWKHLCIKHTSLFLPLTIFFVIRKGIITIKTVMDK